jgi:hypothetical protein
MMGGLTCCAGAKHPPHMLAALHAPTHRAAVAVTVQQCVRLRVRSRSARRRAPEPAAAALPAADPLTGRVHPLERAAAAAALRGQPVDAFADASDALMRGVMYMPLQRPLWREAYASLRLPRLDTITRLFAWWLLHGALRCSATAVLWCKVGTVKELRAAVCCSATACAGDEALEGAQMESLSHIFVQCPVVRPAVAWLRGVWAMLVAGRVPPLDARVLLPGDHTVWCGGCGQLHLILVNSIRACRPTAT